MAQPDLEKANEKIEILNNGNSDAEDEKDDDEPVPLEWDDKDPLVRIFKAYCPEWAALQYNVRYTHVGRWPLASYPGDKYGLLLLKSQNGPIFTTHHYSADALDKKAAILNYERAAGKGKLAEFTSQFFRLLTIPLLDMLSISKTNRKPFTPWQDQGKGNHLLDPVDLAFPQTMPRFNSFNKDLGANKENRDPTEKYVYYLSQSESYFVLNSGKREKVITSLTREVLLGLFYEQIFHFTCVGAKAKKESDFFDRLSDKDQKRNLLLCQYPFTMTAALLNKNQNYIQMAPTKEEVLRADLAYERFSNAFPNLKVFGTFDANRELICSVEHPLYEVMDDMRKLMIEIICKVPQFYSNIRDEYFLNEEKKLSQKSTKVVSKSRFKPSYKYLENEQYSREHLADPDTEKGCFQHVMDDLKDQEERDGPAKKKHRRTETHPELWETAGPK